MLLNGNWTNVVLGCWSEGSDQLATATSRAPPNGNPRYFHNLTRKDF